MTLTEFLLARIAEDQALADNVTTDFPSYPWGSENSELAFMDGPGHPKRVLAECEAKRRIVEYWRMLEEQDAEHPHGEVFGYHATGMKVALRFLALPYADHPDYLPEWRP